MIKKNFLMIICLFLFFSCGKKADPEYKVKLKNIYIIR